MRKVVCLLSFHGQNLPTTVPSSNSRSKRVCSIRMPPVFDVSSRSLALGFCPWGLTGEPSASERIRCHADKSLFRKTSSMNSSVTHLFSVTSSWPKLSMIFLSDISVYSFRLWCMPKTSGCNRPFPVPKQTSATIEKRSPGCQRNFVNPTFRSVSRENTFCSSYKLKNTLHLVFGSLYACVFVNRQPSNGTAAQLFCGKRKQNDTIRNEAKKASARILCEVPANMRQTCGANDDPPGVT